MKAESILSKGYHLPFSLGTASSSSPHPNTAGRTHKRRSRLPGEFKVQALEALCPNQTLVLMLQIQQHSCNRCLQTPVIDYSLKV